MSAIDVSVVIPCLDEEQSVAATVRAARESLEAAGLSFEVVVCDNGSTDASARLASEAGARVVSEARRGYGSAFLAGIAAARGRVLVLGDADGTYPFDLAPAFVERADATGALVMGSRFRGRIMPGSMPALHRIVGSPATRLLVRVLFGVRCSDPHCGMRAMTRELYDRIRPVSRGMEFAIEMVVNASRAGVRIEEIPIDYAARVGDSKLRALPDGWKLLRYLLLHSPTFLFVIPGAVATAAGVSGLVWLGLGSRRVGTATFSINSMLVAALITVVGYQVATLGVSARIYRARIRNERGPVTIERTLAIGILVALTGVAVIAWVGAAWMREGFGPLADSDQRRAIIGLVLGLIGAQTIFSSFFVGVFGGEHG